MSNVLIHTVQVNEGGKQVAFTLEKPFLDGSLHDQIPPMPKIKALLLGRFQ